MQMNPDFKEPHGLLPLLVFSILIDPAAELNQRFRLSSSSCRPSCACHTPALHEWVRYAERSATKCKWSCAQSISNCDSI